MKEQFRVVCFNRNKLYLVTVLVIIFTITITLLLFKYLSKRYKWKY